MRQRPRIYYSEVQKAMMWDRWHPTLFERFHVLRTAAVDALRGRAVCMGK
jgi:hypothetical protein